MSELLNQNITQWSQIITLKSIPQLRNIAYHHFETDFKNRGVIVSDLIQQQMITLIRVDVSAYFFQYIFDHVDHQFFTTG